MYRHHSLEEKKEIIRLYESPDFVDFFITKNLRFIIRGLGVKFRVIRVTQAFFCVSLRHICTQEEEAFRQLSAIEIEFGSRLENEHGVYLFELYHHLLQGHITRTTTYPFELYSCIPCKSSYDCILSHLLCNLYILRRVGFSLVLQSYTHLYIGHI